MSTNYTQQISEEECIGDSLDTINNNFASLDTTCTLLSGTFTAAYVCEMNGVGGIGQILAYGDGAKAHKGLRMPYPGTLIAATLQGADIDGTVAVDPYLNGLPQTNFRLTYTDVIPNIGGGQTRIFNEPLQFNASDTLGWIQVTVPSGGRFNVNYLIKYII
jgi:hypothetical protein